MRPLVLVLVLSACPSTLTEPDAPPIDARVDAFNNTPAIDWSIWGGPCFRGSYGHVTCTASDGTTGGLCILTGDPVTASGYPGACRPTCLSNPPYVYPCPPDARDVWDGYQSQGCYCVQK